MMEVIKVTGASVAKALILASVAGSVLCATFPSDVNVSAYDNAFFPCEVPGKGIPAWVINSTQYYSSELLPDHRTNLSGLLVYARPEYNNTSYQCRFINISITEFGLIDQEVLTSSPAAVLTVKDDGFFEDIHECSCDRNFAIQASYNYLSKVLNLVVNESLGVNYPVPISYCNIGIVEEYLNQTCSAFNVNLNPETFSDLIAVGIPPTCNTCYPDYLIYAAVQFSNNDTVPSSSLQQYQFSGSCLVPILPVALPGQCGNPEFTFSANGTTKTLSLAEQTNFFEPLPNDEGTISVCFQNIEPFFQEFGDVREVLIQEHCAIVLSTLCMNLSLIGNPGELYIYGNKGILTLDANGTVPQPDTVCSLKDKTTSLPLYSSTASASPPTVSTSQHLPTPTLSSSVANSTGSLSSSTPNHLPMTSPTTPSPTTETQPLFGVILGVILALLAVGVVITLIIIRLRCKRCRFSAKVPVQQVDKNEKGAAVEGLKMEDKSTNFDSSDQPSQ